MHQMCTAAGMFGFIELMGLDECTETCAPARHAACREEEDRQGCDITWMHIPARTWTLAYVSAAVPQP